MRYYDAKKNWRKIKRHIDHPDVQKVLVRDFNKFTWGRWRQRFEPGMVPHSFESCDWWCDHQGRMPAFWQYVKHSACHWLCNFNLELAQKVEPNRPWRIITSQDHSTVWDGKDDLFDFNFQALGITAGMAIRMARTERIELKPGEQMKVYMAEHYTRGHGMRTQRGDKAVWAMICDVRCLWQNRREQLMVLNQGVLKIGAKHPEIYDPEVCHGIARELGLKFRQNEFEAV